VDSTKTDPEKQVFVFELPNAVTGQDLATPNTCEPLGVSKQRAMVFNLLNIILTIKNKK
jgi:hypothetical protein